ncbi:MAG: hypothetical protein ACOX0Q_12280 [Syntrophomonadaceae bacterium]|jgi:tRNA U34 5-carboxymethylaminomethyl modifying GTPase MnmE/TrmE
MKELIKELVQSLVEQLEAIEAEVDFDSLRLQTSPEISLEASYLQQQLSELKNRLIEVQSVDFS